MCGIAGVIDGTDGADAALVAAMCDRIVHRGPDSRGVHATGPVGLGVQRLAVIDVAGGDQPLFSEDGSVAVVMNGEIYNFVELRERLEARGHRFATHSDAEVLVHLYEDHADDLVHQLRGMFAFAIWDARRRRLLLGRDRVGKKPLFYAASGGRLVFASEMAALLADPAIDTTLDPQAIDAYLALQYIPHPLTIFRSVRKLPPASLLAFELGGGLWVERYWRLEYEPKLEGTSEQDLVEELRSRLDEATRIRLMSDVPLGALLSGGIDSSAVVASMARQTSRPVKTFSISFGESDFDESRFARMMAERYETEHHELRVGPAELSILPRMARHYGEPYADASAIPSFHLAALAAQTVTVALNGDGGDEAFAGYSRYARMAMLDKLRRAPAPFRSAVTAASRAMGAGRRPATARSRLRSLSRYLRSSEAANYGGAIYAFDAERRNRLLSPELRELLDGGRIEVAIEGEWPAAPRAAVDRVLAFDVETYLPGDLLVKMDIATMAHSLEARSPFLDHELLEFAARLPAGLKLRGRDGKYILKRALSGIVPGEILQRPKMGFGVPLKHWFRGELASLPRDLLLDPQAHCREYLVGSEIESLIDENASGRHDHSQRIWVLVQLEMWHREVLAPRRSLRRAA